MLQWLKATGQGMSGHEGGPRFAAGSWEYRVIHAWIAAGARRDPSRAAAEQNEIHPQERTLVRPGESARLSVVARFTDGSSADVTSFCDFRPKDDAVVLVTPSGVVRGRKPGDTAPPGPGNLARGPRAARARSCP